MNQRIKHGFGIVSNTVLRDPEVSLGEKALYSYLCTYADGATNELYVSVNKIAAECNIGASTVKRHMHTLEQKGILIRVSRGYGISRITRLLK